MTQSQFERISNGIAILLSSCCLAMDKLTIQHVYRKRIEKEEEAEVDP